ncbi:MAG: hypothetical protein ABI851_04055 [Saprospiraceae bacterium]
MRSLILISFSLATLLLLSHCISSDTHSEIPLIKLAGLSKSTMIQGDLNQDSIWISIDFEDGDGDLGWGSSDARKDIFVIDRRTNIISDQFKMPDIPDSNGKLITGTFQIRNYTTCCIFPNNIPPCTSPPQFPLDTISYEIYVKDRAGHESNHVFTQEVVLKCN